MTRCRRRAIKPGFLLGITVCFVLALPGRTVAATEQEMIEQDWRKQDGIATQRYPISYAEAIPRLFERGDALLRDLQSAQAALGALPRRWEDLRQEWQRWIASSGNDHEVGSQQHSRSENAVHHEERAEQFWRRGA